MSLETTATAVSKPPSVFLNRNFLLLYSGEVISMLWDHIYAFALSWYILDLTKSSLQQATFLVIDTIVVALISPLGGLIADRLNRKNIMVWMDVVRGMIVLIMAFLLYYHLLQIWMLYVSAIILGFCGAIFTPAGGAIIPSIVEERQLTQVYSANQFSISICTMLGMLISGVLYNVVGIFMIFLLNAVSYFISGVMEYCVQIPPKKPDASQRKSTLYQEFSRAVRELSEGFRYVRGNKVVYNLLLMNSIFNLVALPVVMVYSPYLFNVILKSTPLQLALPQASTWIGMIIGSFLATLFINRYKLKSSIFWGLLGCGIAIILDFLVVVPQIKSILRVWDISVFMAITTMTAGLSITFFTVSMYTIFQKYTSDEYRGRFWGFQSSLHTFAISIGYFIAGFLAQRVWLGWLFIGVGVSLFIIDLWVVNLKAIKELNE